MYWVFRKCYKEVNEALKEGVHDLMVKSEGSSESSDEEVYNIIQQIPRCLVSFESEMEEIETIQSDLYKKMLATTGMKNLVFDIRRVINDPEQPDVWV